MTKGAGTDDALGPSVSNTGDVNGDGIEDVIIGAYGVSNVGAAFVIYGKDGSREIFSTIDLSQGVNAPQGFRILGSSSESQFGYVLGSARYFNGDGFVDVISNLGAIAIVYMIFGGGNFSNMNLNTALNPTKSIKIKGTNPTDVLGRSLSSVGDINQDGIDDIIIRAPGAQDNIGTAYVIFGRRGIGIEIDLDAGLGPLEGLAINGAGSSDIRGLAVSAGGDVNNDGVPDVIVGTVGANGKV